MEIAYPTVIGYGAAAIGVGLFGLRSLGAYRRERTLVLRNTGRGLLLLALADLVYSLTHLIGDQGLRTILITAGETALLAGAYVVSDFSFSFWGRELGRESLSSALRRALLLLVATIALMNVIFVSFGYRGGLELRPDGYFATVGHAYYSQQEAFPLYSAYLEGLVLLIVGSAAGAALIHQGVSAKSRRSSLLGVGVLFSTLAAVLLTVFSTPAVTLGGIILLIIGIVSLGGGLLTPSEPTDQARVQ